MSNHLMPGAIYVLLPEAKTQRPLEPTQVIVHTAVDAPGPTRLQKWFGRASVKAESHFWIPNDGSIVQMMPGNVQAHANRAANISAISIETEDDGDPEGNPWNQAQLEAIEAVILWANDEYGIPLVRIPSPKAPGIGYHSMFGFTDPRNKRGQVRNPWTSAQGKTCPGKTRTIQFEDDLMPSLKEGLMREFIHPSKMTRGSVRRWQEALNTGGANPALVVDGLYGPKTAAAYNAALASQPSPEPTPDQLFDILLGAVTWPPLRLVPDHPSVLDTIDEINKDLQGGTLVSDEELGAMHDSVTEILQMLADLKVDHDDLVDMSMELKDLLVTISDHA